MPQKRTLSSSHRTGAKRRISHDKVVSIALQARDAMPHCKLDDQAVAFLAIRANSLTPTTQIARSLGMNVQRCYLLMGAPQAQELLQHLAKGVLGAAALQGVATMSKLMGSRDPHIAYKAADAMLERAGLGVSHRQPTGAATAFAFSFSGSRQGATDGTHQNASDPGGGVKNGGSVSGEGESPAILQPSAGKRREISEDAEVQLEVSSLPVEFEEKEKPLVALPKVVPAKLKPVKK